MIRMAKGRYCTPLPPLSGYMYAGPRCGTHTHQSLARPAGMPSGARRGLAASVHTNWRCGDGSGGGGAK